MVVVEMDGLWWSNHLLVGGAVLSHILVPTDHHPENTNTKPNERRPPGLWNRVNHQDICPEKKTCSSNINSLQNLQPNANLSVQSISKVIALMFQHV